jgi:hypothetical protein
MMPDVFFYGLFMDQALLVEKGVEPVNARRAKLEHHSLRIGKRAMLVHDQDSVVYGFVLTLSNAELELLYSEPSVSDYRTEEVVAVFDDGTSAQVLCFNLHESPAAEEHNREYAEKLRTLASKLGLPADYVKSIR